MEHRPFDWSDCYDIGVGARAARVDMVTRIVKTGLNVTAASVDCPARALPLWTSASDDVKGRRMKAGKVAHRIESISPISMGAPGDELGFLFGDGDVSVRGVAVCWAPTLEVIEQAEALGCNMIVCHEPLFYHKSWSQDPEAKLVWFEEADDEDKAVNRGRRAALQRMGGCAYRAHSNWDVVPGIGVIDAAAEALGFGPPVQRGRYTTVHEIQPTTVRALAHRTQQTLGTGPIRVVGDLDREVTRVGTMLGGLGQMFNAPEEMANFRVEAGVFGECLAYGLHLARELNVAVIEAGHGATENPGVRALAQWLTEGLRPLNVRFIDSGRPWIYLHD